MPTIQRIIIDQQYASVGIKVSPAQLSIVTPRPTFDMQQKLPEMQTEQETPSFSLNWSQVYSDIGNKLPQEFAGQVRSQGHGGAMNGTAEAVQDGNFLEKVENPGDRVAQLSRQKTLEQAHVDINIKSVPERSPEVEWNPGNLKIKWDSKQFNVEWDGEYMPEVSLESPHAVEIFLRNRPSIRISVEEVTIPSEAGQHIDKKL